MKYSKAVLCFLFLLLAGSLVAQDTTVEEPIYDSEIGVIFAEEMAYPPLARQARLQGMVVVKARTDGRGNVVSAVAISGHKLLIPHCLENIKKWRFNTNANGVVVIYDFAETTMGCALPLCSGFQLRRPNIALIRVEPPLVQ